MVSSKQSACIIDLVKNHKVSCMDTKISIAKKVAAMKLILRKNNPL